MPLSHGIAVGNTAMVKRRGMKVIDVRGDRSKYHGISSIQFETSLLSEPTHWKFF